MYGRSIRSVSDSIFLQADDGSLTEVSGTPFAMEADLQELLARNVHLLPGAQIDRDSPRRWQLIKREAGIPSQEGGGDWWSVDHLVVDQDAVPTFVEVKRASDTRVRREVVAQMLDYAANGSAFWSPERLRTWYEGNDPEAATQRLVAWLNAEDDDPEAVAGSFWDAVGVNLREGKIRLVFVADEIPPSLQRLVEFLNEQMPRVEVLAVEIRQYRAKDSSSGALVPRLVGQTARAQAAKERPAAPLRRSVRWTAGEVLDWIDHHVAEDQVVVASVVHGWAERHPHVQVTGGTGVSYPSIILSADSGRSRDRYPGVLALYASVAGEPPLLEVRVRKMCEVPRYDRPAARARLVADLQGLGIPRLDSESALAEKRPNIPLDELTGGRAELLMSVVARWIDEVRAHAAKPEAAAENHDAVG